MAKRRRITLIGKERPFDEAKWKELLIAFAYVLHDRRKNVSEPVQPPPPPLVIRPEATP